MDGPIASAVMLPESEIMESPPHPGSPPGGHKRRPSAMSEQDSKRQRLNSIDDDTQAHLDQRPTEIPKPQATNGSGRRERGRERRLFGAALGALSQNSATAAQKRRSEIAERQKAQRVLEEQESDQRKLELATQRQAQRVKEQRRFELESIHLQHANALQIAHFLRTETEPRLYYKPWETTAREDQIIEEQVAEAKKLIRRELEEYEAREEIQSERERHVSRNTDAIPTGKELDADVPPQQHTANGTTDDRAVSPKNLGRREDHAEEAVSVGGEAANQQNDAHTSHEATADEEASKDLNDENGEEIVEAAEDTVIY
ncbi:pinin/SDK/memA/ protein conserved region-domain-containing protein [Dendryphion nanum]|uniref:Pinin/SDK/memA/ protein conserved region-domain-containing protein n=1 Tax=Dendryphion nanum TaxID=256645 RepID=A0A9P9DEQ6_9PLEO|nr:pinin/SDK/memA/ protein conserved region-domain-containing protein [Dendryphion nanum]